MVTSRQKLIPEVKGTGYRICFFCFYVMASLFHLLGTYTYSRLTSPEQRAGPQK